MCLGFSSQEIIPNKMLGRAETGHVRECVFNLAHLCLLAYYTAFFLLLLIKDWLMMLMMKVSLCVLHANTYNVLVSPLQLVLGLAVVGVVFGVVWMA